MEEINIRRKNLVISADDFGMNSKANENILELARSKKIDRVAVLVDSFFSGKEIRDLINSEIKIDIHLAMPGKNKDRHGVIRRSLLFAGRYISGKASVSIVKLAWEKQIKKFQEIFGRVPDGINSHEYVHFFPPYFKIALEMNKKYNIKYVRFGRKGVMKSSHPVSKILRHFHKKNATQFASCKIQTSDYISSLDWIKNFRDLLKNLPEGKTELICHPERKTEFKIIKKYF